MVIDCLVHNAVFFTNEQNTVKLIIILFIFMLLLAEFFSNVPFVICIFPTEEKYIFFLWFNKDSYPFMVLSSSHQILLRHHEALGS